MSEFADRVVLVTGAGRGIGRAIAEAFAEQGAIVAVNDLTPVNLDETVRRIAARGGRVRDYVFDVALLMPVQAMVEQILHEWGRMDILVNNAAVAPRAALLEMDEWDWRRTIDVNLSGPFFTTQCVGRIMRRQGQGAIVNIASTAGWACDAAGRAAFIASKAALIGLTRAAAVELAPYGIRVNAVCPGFIETDAAVGLEPRASPHSQEAEKIPLGRWGQPAEVAQAVMFLCSQAASYISGEVLHVAGGWIEG